MTRASSLVPRPPDAEGCARKTFASSRAGAAMWGVDEAGGCEGRKSAQTGGVPSNLVGRDARMCHRQIKMRVRVASILEANAGQIPVARASPHPTNWAIGGLKSRCVQTA
jgi:hypothetical protein